MNSRRKGKVGEREFASLLRENGYDARRGVQFAGGADSPDVICTALAWLHFEVKRVQNLNLADACAQAQRDSREKLWVVAHRRNHAPWLITMTAEFFFELIREFEPPKGGGTGSSTGKDGDGARSVTRPTLGNGKDGTHGTNDGALNEFVRRTSSGLRPPSPQSGEGDGGCPTTTLLAAAGAAAISTNETKPTNTDTKYEDKIQ